MRPAPLLRQRYEIFRAKANSVKRGGKAIALIASIAFMAMIAIRAIKAIEAIEAIRAIMAIQATMAIQAIKPIPPTAGSCAHSPRMKSEGDCPNMAVKRRAK